MQEASVSALKYDARPPLGSTALKVDGKSCDTQVPPKHPGAPLPVGSCVPSSRDGTVPSPRFKAVGLSPFLPRECSSPGARVTPLLFCSHGHLPNVITRRNSIMAF